MPTEDITRTYDRINVRMAEVLARCADQLTEEEIARSLEISLGTVHDCIADLRHLLKVQRKRDLGRWWLRHRMAWFARLRQRLLFDETA